MNIIESIISAIAPHQCIGCGVNGAVLCEACRLTSLSSPPSRCYRCHAITTQSGVCDKCKKSTSLQHVWVAADYQDIAKQLIYRLKFERASAAAGPISHVLSDILPNLPTDVLVTHIPTASRRARVRGYDQSKLIAKELATQRGWQYQTLLLRRGQSRQVGAGRLERFSQLESAFLAIKSTKIKGAHILLIDDITTTGATLEAATKILKKAGAKTIDAAVFAQPL